MYVLADSAYHYQEYDLRSVMIRIDNTVEVPYLVISYYGNKWSDSRVLRHSTHYYLEPLITLVCSEKYLPEKLLEIGL